MIKGLAEVRPTLPAVQFVSGAVTSFKHGEDCAEATFGANAENRIPNDSISRFMMRVFRIVAKVELFLIKNALLVKCKLNFVHFLLVTNQKGDPQVALFKVK